MKLDIRISKLHNQLFFVSNLSEWNPYCRESYNALWLKRRPLSGKEAQVLGETRAVLRRHPNLAKEFASFRSVEAIQNFVSRKEYEKISTALGISAPRFEKIWLKKEKELASVRQALLRSFHASRKLLGLLASLYRSKAPRDMKIFLLGSPVAKRVINGGSGLGERKIEVECSVISKRNNEKAQAARVILHECIHAAFERKIKAEIKKFVRSAVFQGRYAPALSKSPVYKQTGSFEGVLKEMIAVSLLPEGYLAEKFFRLDVMANLRKRKAVRERKLKNTYYDLMLFSIKALYPKAKEYSEYRKPIDRGFMEAAARAWLTFNEADLSALEEVGQ